MHVTLNALLRMTVLSACASLVALAAPAVALERGVTRLGHAYVSGGVSIEETASLESQRQNYRLWLTTVDSESGAWLADARVVIVDRVQATVLDVRLEGPYLFVDLPPGSYVVTISLGEQVQRHPLTLPTRGLHQWVARFATGAQRSPDLPPHVLAPLEARLGPPLGPVAVLPLSAI